MTTRTARWVIGAIVPYGSFVLVACAKHTAPAPPAESPSADIEVVTKKPDAESLHRACAPLPSDPPRCAFTPLTGLPPGILLHAVSADDARVFAIGSRQEGAKHSILAVTAQLDGTSMRSLQVDEWSAQEPMLARAVNDGSALLEQRTRALELVDRKSGTRQVVSGDAVVWAALDPQLVAFVPAARPSELSLVPLESGQVLGASARTIPAAGGRVTALPRLAGEGAARRLYFARESAACSRDVVCGSQVVRRQSCIELGSVSLSGVPETRALSLPLDVFSFGGVVRRDRETAILVGLPSSDDACGRTRPVAMSANSNWVDPMHASPEQCPAGTGLDLALLLGDAAGMRQVVQFGSDREDVPVSLAAASEDGAYWVSWCAPVADTQSCFVARLAPGASRPDAEVCFAGTAAPELVSSGSTVIAYVPGHHEIVRVDHQQRKGP